MALKNMIDRYKKRRRDAGAGLVDTVVGLGLAAIIIGGPILYFTTVNNAAAGAASTQGQNTAISEALDRAVANIQASDTIVYAGPNELVTRSTEVEEGKADNPVITRWVVNGGKLYQQSWSGAAGVDAYDRSTLPTAASGSATVNTRVSVENLQLDADLFTYTDKDGADLDVKAPKWALTENARTNPADGKKTYDIALVNMAIKAGTTVDGTGKTGIVENKTSAAPRSVSGKAGPDVVAEPCPAVDIDTNAAGQPVITWRTLVGYTSYKVTRNNTQVALVTAAASDTQKSWTDNSVVAGPSEVINYRVQARNADGSIASIACTPKPWSPQIDAPAFKNSGVLPSADRAHEWTDGTDGALGLKKPRIVLQWNAVAGATSYDLKYRELDPATGNPLTTAFNSAAAGLPAATTKFTWDEGGWAASYEWYIKANAGAGQGQSAESAHITTLTHPPAPQNVDVTPQYGTGSARLTSGNNVITWSASPTAVEYDVWRYNSGSTGTVTKLGTVKASAARTYTDTVPYGTSWTYYVAAVNDGPRGNGSGKASSASPEAGVTTATGTMPTVSFREPAGGMIMSTMAFTGNAASIVTAAVNQEDVKPAPKKVSQLQFPPIPVESSSRDFDGYNQFSWKPALSATGYQVARFDYNGGGKRCLTTECTDSNGTDGGGGTTETSIQDRAVARGSKFQYAAQAYNATGLSVELSDTEELTQRPAAPALKVTRAPSESDNTTDFQIVQNADAGNTGANRFCTKDTCEYQLDKTVTTPTTATSKVVTVDHLQSGATQDFKKAASPEGYTTTFTARSKNDAKTNNGYSDDANVTVDTLPGSFWVSPAIGDINWNQAHRVKLDKVNMDGPGDSNNATTVRWGPSSGADSISYTRRALSGDTVNASLGLSPSSAPSGGSSTGAQGAGDDTATPGAAYAYDVTATGFNGKKRKITSNPIITPAAISKTGTLQVTCAGRDDRVFTEAQVRPGGNYFAGVMSQPYYGQKISTKLIRSDPAGSWTFDAAPPYGRYKNTDYNGIVNGSGTTQNTYYGTGSNYEMTGQWTASKGDFSSSDGYTYRMGLRNGFQVITQGANFSLPDAQGNYSTYTGPGSYALVAYVEVIGTFQYNNNCASFSADGPDMNEPNTPCYSFTGAACSRKDYATRPHWLSQ